MVFEWVTGEGFGGLGSVEGHWIFGCFRGEDLGDWVA